MLVFEKPFISESSPSPTWQSADHRNDIPRYKDDDYYEQQQQQQQQEPYEEHI